MIVFADGTLNETCQPRGESAALTDKTKSLFLENYFPSNPNRTTACIDNSALLSKALNVCHTATGNRWANFLAVDYYQVRDTAEAIDGRSCRNLYDSMFDLSFTLKNSKSVFTYACFLFL